MKCVPLYVWPILLALGCHACSGGTSTSSSGAPSAALVPTHATLMNVVIAVPRGAASQASRDLKYISARTQSASLSIASNGAAARTLTTACSSYCSFSAEVVPGSTGLTLRLYSQPNATGALLSEGSTTTNVLDGQVNQIALALGGVASSAVLALDAPAFQPGRPQTAHLSLRALDATGETIIGSTPFLTPVSVSVGGDVAHELKLDRATFSSPNDAPIAATFNGGSTDETLTLSASGTMKQPDPLVVEVRSDAMAPIDLNPSGQGNTAALNGALLTPEKARSADGFVDSIGVNVHLSYNPSVYYTNFDRIQAFLLAAGIRHIRDGMIDTNDQLVYDHFKSLAANGIQATLATKITDSDAFVQSFPSRVPNEIEAIEAPNEYDRSGDPHWASNIASYQRQLYAAVKSGPLTAGIPVLGPSLTSAAAYAAVGDLSGYLDYGNMHNYFSGFNPGTPGYGGPGFGSHYGSIAWNIGAAAQVSGAKPIITTETGYETCPNTHADVTPQVMGTYVPRMFLEQWNAGVPRTLEYTLVDFGPGCSDTYGLIDGNLTPRPAYSALASMMNALKDPGPSYNASSLAYTLSGETTNVHHALLQKRDGTFELVMWIEASSWDVNAGSSGAPLTVLPQHIMLGTAAMPASATLKSLDPDGTFHVVPLVWNGGTTQFTLTDHVSIMELRQ